MTSPESDPIKHLKELTTKAGESLGDDAVFDATIKELNDKLLAEELRRLDKLLGISKQYEFQMTLIREGGFLHKLPDGSEGIVGSPDGTLYPIPSLLSVVQRFCEDGKKYELLRRKVEQGFTELIMVPFVLTLDRLQMEYAFQLERHESSGLLFGEGQYPSAINGVGGKVLALDVRRPVHKWEAYDSAKIVYFPKSFDQENHGGMTKEEAIAQKGAWQVYLVEETPIPRHNRGAVKNGRKQLEAGLSPRDYLEKIQADPQYKGEEVLTPEAWFMRAITHLKKKNEVIDDFLNKGSVNYTLGAFFPRNLEVSRAYWHHEDHKVHMGYVSSSNTEAEEGTSTVVPI